MKNSKASSSDHRILRDTLANLPPEVASQADEQPKLEEIFSPTAHANALDPQRALIIGNRGVGKSFWSSVLTHEPARIKIASDYPRLPLARIRAHLGFHEAAGKDEGPAPSAAVLAELLRHGEDPETIWRAVLIKALGSVGETALPSSLKDVIAWMRADVERAQAFLRRADNGFMVRQEIFLLVFDALDRLGTDWKVITSLTEGILRFALDMRGYKAMKAKVFIRSDQSKDDSLFRFADASKIRSSAVSLVWKQVELFGLLYKKLLADDMARDALSKLAGYADSRGMGDDLLHDQDLQEQLFYRLAGEFMGSGPRRGRTYNWLHDHLADTFGETSPRSFLKAVQSAAAFDPAPRDTAFDHNGIRAGVQDASEVRVDQLKEDYAWIEKTMGALRGLEVPCEPSAFTKRWVERGTVAELRSSFNEASSSLPLEFAVDREGPRESALLKALQNIGVVEFRTENRINMPDIFRVEAGIKRKGGVRPPPRRG